jgi:C-terminal processing protease CtpA/Prc
MAVASGTWVREVRADPISDDTGYLDLQFDADYPGPGLRVADVLPGGATSRMALAPAAGEYIHTIDGRAINKPEEVWDALRARAGREASLVVAPTPPGDAAEVTPGLRTLRVPLLGQAGYRRLEEAAWSGEQAARLAKLTSGVARYVRLRGFSDQDMRRFAADLRWDPSGVRVLVVDMRDLDGEGDPARALAVLLDRRLSGVVGDLVPAPARLPLVLLVNERASGCAEALAIVLQASGQAKVVGAPTAGLAWVTRSHRLPCGLTLVAADAAYCEQGGRSLAGRHVEPDLAAPDSGAQLAEAAAVALRLAAEGSNAPPRD